MGKVLTQKFQEKNKQNMAWKAPTNAAEGCSPPQELEKNGRRAEIFLGLIIMKIFLNKLGKNEEENGD